MIKDITNKYDMRLREKKIARENVSVTIISFNVLMCFKMSVVLFLSLKKRLGRKNSRCESS